MVEPAAGVTVTLPSEPTAELYGRLLTVMLVTPSTPTTLVVQLAALKVCAETDSVAYAEEGYAASEWSFVHGTDEQAADQQAAAEQDPSERADYDEQAAPTEVYEAVQPQQSDDTEIFEAVKPQPSDDTEVFPAVELPNDKQGPRK